ncbi:MAG: DUF5711 family protein [Candidatus Hodarchaeaceae archaeon]|nr:DUF5711 family protein [Candidatus Hodarchaeaceae archaeon]
MKMRTLMKTKQVSLILALSLALSSAAVIVASLSEKTTNAGSSFSLSPRDENRLLWSYQTDYPVRSVSISSDGGYIAAAVGGPWKGRVYLFSKTGGAPLWEYPPPFMDDDVFTSISISSDGSYLAAVQYRDQLHLFRRSDNTPLWTSKIRYAVPSVSISSDGNYIATCTCYNYGAVYLFSKDNNVPQWEYQPGAGNLFNSISISSDGSRIAAGGYNPANEWGFYGMVYLFSLSENIPLWCYRPNSWVRSVSISSDGSHIVAGDITGNIYLFSSSSATPRWSYNTDSYNQHVDSVAISSDGSYIAVGSSPCGYPISGEHRVYLFSNSSSNPIWDYKTGGYVHSVAISSDGSYIAAGGHDNKVYFFSRASSTPLWIYETDANVYSVSISSDGNYIVAGDTDGKVYLLGRAPLPTLTISPSSFSCSVGQSTTLTATLTSNGNPIVGKTIYWGATTGNLSPTSGTTDKEGRVSTVYTAPNDPRDVTIVASFVGDEQYLASSENSSCTVYFTILTFCKPDGSPLTNTGIYYGFSSDQVTNYLGTTDNKGKIGLENSDLSGQTIYFKTSDGRYTGSSSIGSSGGEVTPELTEIPKPAEVSEPPILWLAVVVLIVAVAIGALLLVKKRK